MALPLLKDYLPQDRPYSGIPEDLDSPDFLDEHEAKLIRAEQTAVALSQAIERFVSAIGEALPGLSEDELVSAYEQIEAEDRGSRPRRTLAAFERAKEEMETLRDAVLVREAQEFSTQVFWDDD